MLNGKNILITGGTGSFGKKFTEMVLNRYPRVHKLIILSRDELKQFEMAQAFSPEKYPAIRYFLGDVRDGDRLRRAFEGVDVVIHSAALKQVPAAEYNPMECIKTNVLGAENVINAALDCGVKKVVALSTDKAAAPINLYGATKLCSDKLFVAANNMKGSRDLTFSVVRYGNVLGSRGSVVPYFMQQRLKKVLPITHPEMTRFNITLEQAVELVFYALENSWGGEIFVPRIPSYRIMDMAAAIGPDCRKEIVGIRPGEKLHEELITEMDSLSTHQYSSHYEIAPARPVWSEDERLKKFGGKRVSERFAYTSGTNDWWLSVDELRAQIREHVEPYLGLGSELTQ